MGDLLEVQIAYGESCSRYEEKASSKLAQSDTIIASGYGCSLSVKHDALHIFPGRTHKDQQQDTSMLYRGVHGIKQIILLSDKGTITLDAIRWAMEQGIAITMIDGHGNLMQSLTPEHESNAALRRRQYHATDNGLDIYVAREIVRNKVDAQIATLKKNLLPKKEPICQTVRREVSLAGMDVTDTTASSLPFQPVWYYLEEELANLSRLNTLGTIRMMEARCGVIYWYAFLGTPIKWSAADARKIPPHWLHINRRASSVSNDSTACHSANPYHAVTNYAYALLESQCRQSIVAQGFDPACGFLHVDMLHRDGLVFDVMDAGLRPMVDQLVLKLFASTTLTKGEFMSTKDGTIRFNRQFSRYIAAMCRLPQQDIDVSVSWLKDTLLSF